MSMFLEVERIILALLTGLIAIGFFSVYWQLRHLQDQLMILSRRTALAGALFVGWSSVLNASVLYFGLGNAAYIQVMTAVRVIVTLYASYVAVCALKAYWETNGKRQTPEVDTEHND